MENPSMLSGPMASARGHKQCATSLFLLSDVAGRRRVCLPDVAQL